MQVEILHRLGDRSAPLLVSVPDNHRETLGAMEALGMSLLIIQHPESVDVCMHDVGAATNDNIERKGE